MRNGKLFGLLGVILLLGILTPYHALRGEPLMPFPDSNSTFVIGDVSGFAVMETVLVPIYFHTQKPISYFKNSVIWDDSDIHYVGYERGSGWPESAGSLSVTNTDTTAVIEGLAPYPNEVAIDSNQVVYYLKFWADCDLKGSYEDISFTSYNNWFNSHGASYEPMLDNGKLSVPHYTVWGLWGHTHPSPITVSVKQQKIPMEVWTTLDFPASGFTHFITYDSYVLEFDSIVPNTINTVELAPGLLKVYSNNYGFGPCIPSCSLYTLYFNALPCQDSITTRVDFQRDSANVAFSACGSHEPLPWQINPIANIQIPDYQGTYKIEDVNVPLLVDTFRVNFNLKNNCQATEHYAKVLIPKDTLKFVGVVQVLPFEPPVPQYDSLTGRLWFFNANANIGTDTILRPIFQMKFKRKADVANGTKVHLVFDNSGSNNWFRNTVDGQCYIDVNPQNGDLGLINGSVTFGRSNPGCPFIYVWDGKSFVQDNTILTASEYKKLKGEGVTDYYLLTQTPQLKDGKYYLQIREFEQEKSYLDDFELICVDHSPEVRVGVTPEGRIFAYDQEVALMECMDKNGVDQLRKLKDKDKNYYNSEGAGELLLDFGHTGDAQIVMALPARPKPPVDEELLSKLAPMGTSSISVAVLDQKGNWAKISDLPPRSNDCMVFALVNPGEINMGERMKIKLSWENKYETDEIRFYQVNRKKAPRITTCDLSGAVHSRKGEISNLLATDDKGYVNLTPGERVDLYFTPKGEPETGLVRDFILISRGYYEKLKESYTLESASTPNDFALFDNYPNPFNPSTEIAYNLPLDVKVKLTIYNILGEKVKILVDEYQTAGYKTAHWDGTDEYGKEVSSGIYFYRLSAGNFTQSKKMTLVK